MYSLEWGSVSYFVMQVFNKKEGENNQRQKEKQAIRICGSFYLLLTQLVMRYEHHKLHVSFLARKRNKPAKEAGKKKKSL